MATCFGKSCSFRFSMRVFYKRLSVCMCASFPHSFEGWVWDLIILVRDRCLFLLLSRFSCYGMERWMRVLFLAHLSHRLRLSYCYWPVSVVRRASSTICFKQHLL